MERYKFFRNTAIFISGTFLSRFLGFIRDILFARFFGASPVFEAFIVAFRIPNLLRSLLGEGFADSVSTPVLSKYIHDKKRLFEISNHLILVISFSAVLITVLGIVFSPLLVRAIVPGFIPDSYKFFLTVSFTRLSFIYLFFIALTSNLRAFLSALKKFFLPAFSPCILNFFFITGVLFFHDFLDGFILIVAVLLGGVVEFYLYYLVTKKIGLSFNTTFQKAFKDKVIFHMFRLFLPRMWSSVIYQLNVFIDTIFSSLVRFVGEGGVAAIYYANRIIQLPFALVALSVSRVAMVDFSRLYKESKKEEFKQLFVFSLRNILFLIIPVTFILTFIATLIINVLFFRGAFTAYALSVTSRALFFYALGLPFFCLVKLLTSAFYALEDTVTPAKVSTVSLIINAALNGILMIPLKIGGIAFASSVAAVLNFFILYRIFIKKVGRIEWKRVKKEIGVLIFSGVVMGVFSFIMSKVIANKYLSIFTILAGDLMIFYLFVRIFRINIEGGAGGWLFPYGRK